MRGVVLGLMLVCLAATARAQADVDSCAVGRLGRVPANVTEAATLPALVPGVTLPVVLRRTLRAGHTAVGTAVTARLTQRTPVAAGMYIGRGAEVLGTVTESTAGDGTAAHTARLAIQFKMLRWHGQSVAVNVNAVAVANFTDVQATAAPVAGFADIVNPDASNWTTRQVGGDEVYRSDWLGPVCNDVMRPVGMADFYGVYSLPGTVMDGVALPFARALDVFSSSAHGVYGLDDGTKLGLEGVVVTSPARKLTLYGEDHVLLIVMAAPR